MIDNPQWLDLHRQMAKLQQRYEELLLDRTSLHPLVQDMAVQIEDLKQQMAAVPRQIAGKLPAALGNGAEADGQASEP